MFFLRCSKRLCKCDLKTHLQQRLLEATQSSKRSSTHRRSTSCLLTFIDITKQKTLTRLPPWTSSWAILILHLQTPERRKGTANWGQKQELTSSGDVNYPSFTYSKLGGWMWKDMKRAWHVSLWLLVTSSAANCKFAKNLSLWQVCLKFPFRFHETSNKGKAETVYVLTLSVSDAKATARQLKVEIKHCQKSTSTVMRNCMKLQIPSPSRITSQHPDFRGFQWQYCSWVSEKCTWPPTRSKDPGTTNVSEKSSVTFGWGLEGCNHSGDALRLILYTYRYRTPSQWMNCKFAVPKLPTQSNPWSQRQAMNGNLSHWVFLQKAFWQEFTSFGLALNQWVWNTSLASFLQRFDLSNKLTNTCTFDSYL